jgi:hypothetical protein
MLVQALPFRHAAVQRILWAVAMHSDREEDSRPHPAKVYPVAGEAEGWVVEPPASGLPAGTELRTFSGAAGLAEALEYSHRTYGSALYLSR